jgi:TrmH family RNA methyltransferase
MEVWLASASRGTPYSRVDWRQRCAIVIGGEAEGASAGGQGLATGNVLIPMPGEAESLNAAVAAAILLFEAVRQRSDHPATGV